METTELIKQLKELGFIEIHNVERLVESPFIYYQGKEYQGKEFVFYRDSDGLWKFLYSVPQKSFCYWSNKNWIEVPSEHSISISDMMVLYGL